MKTDTDRKRQETAIKERLLELIGRFAPEAAPLKITRPWTDSNGCDYDTLVNWKGTPLLEDSTNGENNPCLAHLKNLTASHLLRVLRDILHKAGDLLLRDYDGSVGKPQAAEWASDAAEYLAAMTECAALTERKAACRHIYDCLAALTRSTEDKETPLTIDLDPEVYGHKPLPYIIDTDPSLDLVPEGVSAITYIVFKEIRKKHAFDIDLKQDKIPYIKASILLFRDGTHTAAWPKHRMLSDDAVLDLEEWVNSACLRLEAEKNGASGNDAFNKAFTETGDALAGPDREKMLREAAGDPAFAETAARLSALWDADPEHKDINESWNVCQRVHALAEKQGLDPRHTAIWFQCGGPEDIRLYLAGTDLRRNPAGKAHEFEYEDDGTPVLSSDTQEGTDFGRTFVERLAKALEKEFTLKGVSIKDGTAILTCMSNEDARHQPTAQERKMTYYHHYYNEDGHTGWYSSTFSGPELREYRPGTMDIWFDEKQPERTSADWEFHHLLAEYGIRPDKMEIQYELWEDPATPLYM